MAQNDSKPIVFHYQPTKFIPVSKDKLKDWERDLKEKVGFKGNFDLGTATATTSCCPDADDCDQD